MAKERKHRRNYQVFVSHSAADKDYARQLRNLLLSQQPSLSIFTTSELSAGDDWKLKLKKAISDCDFFMVLLSPKSVESNWVLYELGVAWGLQKVIIPVVTNREIVSRLPVRLSKDQLVDLTDLENADTMNQILEHYEDSIALGGIRSS